MDSLFLTPTDAETFLNFWFEGPIPESAEASLVQRWFLPPPEFAATCRIFSPLTKLPLKLPETPQIALAQTILLSRLPRILSPDGDHTETDRQAREVVEYVMDSSRRWDLEWKRAPAVRMWFLMAGDQKLAIERAKEMVEDMKEIVDGVWDGKKIAEAVNVLRFLEEKEKQDAKVES
ncbi:hypothetical protein BZA77DRAFT_314326 [Pyronema omphalodes]|nr:hypothetical protein BZA77DRAFT_314326 [Pyronema omphalodes]